MKKQTFDNYLDELEFQKKIWSSKPSLRQIYGLWYAKIASKLSSHRPVVELGAGCGNFKHFMPDVIATDAIKCGDHIDKIVDAMDMPFANGEVGNFVMIDCLHHLPSPLRFFSSASRALKPGGRIVLFEPACTPWARLVFTLFHHENIDLAYDVFAEKHDADKNEGLLFNNMGIATIMFIKNRRKFEELFPELKIVDIEISDFLVYPATGGFSYLCLMPAFLTAPLAKLESLLCKFTAKWLTGMRLCIALEKTEAKG